MKVIIPNWATGPEYEALRRLPLADQKRIWGLSFIRVLKTWKGFYVACCFLCLCFLGGLPGQA